MGPVEKAMRAKIESELQPSYYELENESSQHSVPPGSETHFRVLLVSEKFAGLSRVDRSRRVNVLFATELRSGVHALSQRTFTPEEWAKVADSFQMQSPACMGGSKAKA